MKKNDEKNGQGQVEELPATSTRKKKPVLPGPRRPSKPGGLRSEPTAVGAYLRLEGWKQIALFFPDGCGPDTLYKRYGKEMLDAGYVFKSVILGSDGKRRWQVWTYDFLVASFISQKQAVQGYV